MIALFSQAQPCVPTKCKLVLGAECRWPGERTQSHTQSNSVLQNGFLKVCVTFPGPDRLRDSQEGLEGLGLFWGVRTGSNFRVCTCERCACETV